MECRIDEVLVHYVEHGSGVPLVALHGAGVDHREIEAAIEAVVPSGGLPADLPGPAGDGPLDSRRPRPATTTSSTLLGDFIDHLGEGPVLLVGHSYGAYLARGRGRTTTRRGARSGVGVPRRRAVTKRARPRGGPPGRRRVRRTRTCAAGGVRRVLRRAHPGHRSPLPRPRRAGHDARRRGCAGAHLRRMDGRRRVRHLLGADPDRGRTTRLRRRVRRRRPTCSSATRTPPWQSSRTPATR